MRTVTKTLFKNHLYEAPGASFFVTLQGDINMDIHSENDYIRKELLINFCNYVAAIQ